MYWRKTKQPAGPTNEQIRGLFAAIREHDQNQFGLTNGQIGEISSDLLAVLEGQGDVADFAAALGASYGLAPRNAGVIISVTTKSLYPAHLDRLKRP